MRTISALLICSLSLGLTGCSKSKSAAPPTSAKPPKLAPRELTESDKAAILRGSLDAAREDFREGRYRALFARIDPACRADLLDRLTEYDEFGSVPATEAAKNSEAVVIPLRSMVPFVPKRFLLREPSEDEPDPWSAVKMPEYFSSIMSSSGTRNVRWSIERVIDGRQEVVEFTEDRVKILVRDTDGIGNAETTMWLVRKDGEWFLNFQVPPLR